MKITTTQAVCAIVACITLQWAGAATAQTSANKTKQSSSRAQTKTKANQLAAAVVAAEDALTPEQLAIADFVYTGRIACENGNQVTVQLDPKMPGYFNVSSGKQRFRMVPAVTTTGAVRLEDKKTGGVWLQISNKSMLLNERVGQRIADECAGTAQQAFAAQMKANPPVSVLDAPTK
jgi:hypothetical protein